DIEDSTNNELSSNDKDNFENTSDQHKSPDSETIIKLISICLEYNYLLVSENANFATEYQKLTAEIKDLIEKYTLCDLDVLSQVQLLYELFPEATIVDYD
ncbi:1661_t:CDS:2, partial [Scutellospora calospora]